jgi:TonB family protein
MQPKLPLKQCIVLILAFFFQCFIPIVRAESIYNFDLERWLNLVYSQQFSEAQAMITKRKNALELLKVPPKDQLIDLLQLQLTLDDISEHFEEEEKTFVELLTLVTSSSGSKISNGSELNYCYLLNGYYEWHQRRKQEIPEKKFVNDYYTCKSRGIFQDKPTKNPYIGNIIDAANTTTEKVELLTQKSSLGPYWQQVCETLIRTWQPARQFASPMVVISINSDGSVSACEITRSFGSIDLDYQALKSIRKCHFPKFPGYIGLKNIKIKVDLRFLKSDSGNWLAHPYLY